MSTSVPPAEVVRPGLWSIGVPFPNNPLGYTLVYLIESDRGPVLVDAGWDDDESWNALVDGFRTAGTDVSACYGVLVTHVHPDHHGLSGRVREASDAWVAMHERDAVTVEHLSSVMAQENERSDDRSQTLPDFTDELISVLLDAGASEDELMAAPASSARRRVRRFRPLATPDRTLDDGARADVPGWDVAAVWTPGHTPGHLCFHLPEQRVLLSGDHVLPAITPHISISRRDRAGDPLGDFLDSLQKVARLQTDEVLPAHRHRFNGLAASRRRDHPPPPRAPGRHRNDARRRPGVVVADRRPPDVEPTVGPVPPPPAPLRRERDRRPPALPHPPRPGCAAEGRAAVHVRAP